MNIRLFSKKHNLYTNSPFWPSNQQSFSDWSLLPSGEILELIYFGGKIEPISQIHDSRTFEVEPWTGYFDSTGKKIYRGDIIECESMFHFISEVTWKEGAFWLKTLDGHGLDRQFNGYLSNIWTVTKNIHGVEYAD